MNIHFTKMHALGNNYIYINQFEEQIAEEHLASLAVQVSNVRTGIGSDGMILICPSDVAELKMRVFNSDGSEAKNCGNGLRCVARYAYDHGLVTKKSFTIETLGGVVQAHVHEEHDQVQHIAVNMGEPRLKKADLPLIGGKREVEDCLDETIVIDGQSIPFVGVSMGNPHVVIFVEDVEQAPVSHLGPKIEKHDWFPEGTNVEFIQVRDRGEIDFRVWERGSGMTYACGTGACAAVVAAVLKGYVSRGEAVTVHLLGGDLVIEWKHDGHVWMQGPAEYICKGELLL
jgi:diaminopimelate epimerase